MESTKAFEAKLHRIFQATNARSDAELARILDIKAPSVAGARKREQIPTGWVEKVAKSFGVNANWLFFGEGPVYDPERTKVEPARAGMMQAGRPLQEVVVQDKPQPTADRTIEHDTGDIIMVPMVEARLSAGTGSFENGNGQERFYAFRLDFLRRKGIPSQMALMRVSGDSMEPEIKDGDVVLIDQNQKTPTPGKLFAVGVEDMVYIKEVNAEPGKLVLSSYNKAYPALEVDARGDLATDIRIIGRAVWVGRELK